MLPFRIRVGRYGGRRVRFRFTALALTIETSR